MSLDNNTQLLTPPSSHMDSTTTSNLTHSPINSNPSSPNSDRVSLISLQDSLISSSHQEYLSPDQPAVPIATTPADIIHTLGLYRYKLNKSSSLDFILEYAKFILFQVIPVCLNTQAVQSKKQDLLLEAHSLLKKADPLPEAQFLLAEQYESGCTHKKQKPNLTKAFKLYMKAAKQNHIESIYRVSTFYEAGLGTSKSNSRALQFFLKAAAVGHPGSCYRLGMAELQGQLGMDKNARNGIKWLKHAVANATPEHCESLYELAILHEVGVEHVVFVDNEYSVSLLQQAATLGHVPSMYRLGSYYEHGNFVEKDPCTSFYFYKAAAERGHQDSMFGVASWYLTGHNEASVPQSDELAFSWMLTASKLGLVKAFFAVGYLYEEGIGTEVNLDEAKVWYHLALTKGDLRAKPRLSAIIIQEKKQQRSSMRKSIDRQQQQQQQQGIPQTKSSLTTSIENMKPSVKAAIQRQQRQEHRQKVMRERNGEDACTIM